MSGIVMLLRAVNVGGRVMKMDRLRAVMDGLGLKDVRTYVQSGNVVCAGKTVPKALGAKVEAALADAFGYEVAVVLRSGADLGRVLTMNPYLRGKKVDPKQLYVTFLTAAPTKAGLAKLGGIRDAATLVAAGTEIYLHCPEGYGRTKLNNVAIERALGLTATTRNWATVSALHEMAAQSGG